MMIYLGSVLPGVLPALAYLLWYLRTRYQFTPGRVVMTAGFALYLLLVSKYTVFPLWIDWEYIEAARSQSTIWDGVNLVPFKDWSIKYLMSTQGWGNIALGMPFGFLYPFVVPIGRWQQMARYGVLFSTSIEAIQCVISLCYGFAYRVIDVNDILLNSAGAMLGYALLKVIAFLHQAVPA